MDIVFGGAGKKGSGWGGSKIPWFWQNNIVIKSMCFRQSRLNTETWEKEADTVWKIVAVLFWAYKHTQLHTCADYDDLPKATISLFFFGGGGVSLALPQHVLIFLFSEPAHIRLTLCFNVGTCKTLSAPSVTLQMALLVKVGHARTLPSTQDGTMEITGVWSLGLNAQSQGCRTQGGAHCPDLWIKEL